MTHPSPNLFPSPEVFPGPDPAPPISTRGMTLEEASNELADRGFDYLSSFRKTQMLNDAKNFFEDAWEFPWLQRLISGQAPLLIPDLKQILTVKTNNSYCAPCDSNELYGIDIRVLAQGSTDLSQTGTPQYWYLIPGGTPEASPTVSTVEFDFADAFTLYTWPVAETTLDVFYIAQTPELELADDRPLIPPRYRSIWIDLAVIQAYQDSDNFQAANALRADVDARIHNLIERYETFNRQHSGFISSRGFSEDE